MIVTTNDKHYHDIADAIRAKLGTTDRYKPEDMAAAVAAIESVGGGAIPSVSPKEVNFYDYDGKLLYSYTLAEAQSLAALPDAPDHSSDTIPLTFQGWNYTLEQVNTLTDKANIGATYIPVDGKTHLTIHIAEPGRMVVPLYFSQTVENGVIIDWGDGSPPQTLTGTGNRVTTHTYSATGIYDITLDVTSGVLGLGANLSDYCVLGSTGDEGGRVYCNMLKSVRIGNSVTTIGSDAFYYCTSLESVTISNSVTTIGTYAFAECWSLASITIPNSVTTIGTYAFGYCYSLEPITIPNSVTTIGKSAFAGCYGLSSITIPNSVTKISETMFRYCRSLASVTIPNSVTTIVSLAFEDCYCLASITIPNSVTKIGTLAFTKCYGMAHYYFYSTTPPTLDSTNVFSSIPSDCVIHVPAASLSEYQSAKNWTAYAAKMVGDL